MLNRLRKRRLLTATVRRGDTTARRPHGATADRTEEAAALLFVNHTALGLGRCR